MMVDIGAVQGRFQGLHYGHMEFLLEAKKRCRFLIVGVTNYDLTDERLREDACSNRMHPSANPFTYYERAQMIRSALSDAGIALWEFCVTPFPIDRPEKICNFVPRQTVFFQTIYDQWGEQKVQTLQKLGYSVQVMWRRTDAQRFSSGTQVREWIAQGKPWQTLVPPAVAQYIRQEGLEQRLRDFVPEDQPACRR